MATRSLRWSWCKTFRTTGPSSVTSGSNWRRASGPKRFTSRSTEASCCHGGGGGGGGEKFLDRQTGTQTDRWGREWHSYCQFERKALIAQKCTRACHYDQGSISIETDKHEMWNQFILHKQSSSTPFLIISGIACELLGREPSHGLKEHQGRTETGTLATYGIKSYAAILSLEITAILVAWWRATWKNQVILPGTHTQHTHKHINT